jgi:hypothetical protein
VTAKSTTKATSKVVAEPAAKPAAKSRAETTSKTAPKPIPKSTAKPNPKPTTTRRTRQNTAVETEATIDGNPKTEVTLKNTFDEDTITEVDNEGDSTFSNIEESSVFVEPDANNKRKRAATPSAQWEAVIAAPNTQQTAAADGPATDTRADNDNAAQDSLGNTLPGRSSITSKAGKAAILKATGVAGFQVWMAQADAQRKAEIATQNTQQMAATEGPATDTQAHNDDAARYTPRNTLSGRSSLLLVAPLTARESERMAQHKQIVQRAAVIATRNTQQTAAAEVNESSTSNSVRKTTRVTAGASRKQPAQVTPYVDLMELWNDHPPVVLANGTSVDELDDTDVIPPEKKEKLRVQAVRYRKELDAAYQLGDLRRPVIDWQIHVTWWASRSRKIADSIQGDFSVVKFPALGEKQLVDWSTFLGHGGDITQMEYMDFILSLLWWHRSLRGLVRTVPYLVTFCPGRGRILSEKKTNVILRWLERQKNRTAWKVGKQDYGEWERFQWFIAAPCETLRTGGPTAEEAAEMANEFRPHPDDIKGPDSNGRYEHS